MGHPVGRLQIHGSKRQSTTHECYFIIDFSFCARVQTGVQRGMIYS